MVFYACTKGTKYQDRHIYIKIYLFISRFQYIYIKIPIFILRFVYLYQDAIYLHQDSYIYISYRIFVSRFAYLYLDSYTHIMFRIFISRFIFVYHVLHTYINFGYIFVSRLLNIFISRFMLALMKYSTRYVTTADRMTLPELKYSPFKIFERQTWKVFAFMYLK